jgi:hypothetical protein
VFVESSLVHHVVIIEIPNFQRGMNFDRDWKLKVFASNITDFVFGVRERDGSTSS